MNQYEALSSTEKVREITPFIARERLMGNWEAKAIQRVGKVYPKALQHIFTYHYRKRRIQGHSHHIWRKVPLQHNSECKGYIFARVVGTQYHLVNSL